MFLGGREQHRHVPAVEAGGTFYYRVAVQNRYYSVEQVMAALGMRNFPPPKNNRYLDAIFLLEEFFNVIYLKIYIVGFDLRAYLYFFNYTSLPSTGFALALALLVKVFAEIHYPTNGGLGVSRDFYQVEPFFLRSGQSVAGGDYADLFSLVVY